MNYLFLILAFVFNASANILLKVSSSKGFSFSNLLQLKFSIGEIYFITALLCFGVNLCFYVVALAKIPLSTAYPVMVGMTFLITLFVSTLLGEKMSNIHILGILLILSGLILVSRYA